jgi:hypothetical protein
MWTDRPDLHECTNQYHNMEVSVVVQIYFIQSEQKIV